MSQHHLHSRQHLQICLGTLPLTTFCKIRHKNKTHTSHCTDTVIKICQHWYTYAHMSEGCARHGCIGGCSQRLLVWL
jgi:hypothetical protein